VWSGRALGRPIVHRTNPCCLQYCQLATSSLAQLNVCHFDQNRRFSVGVCKCFRETHGASHAQACVSRKHLQWPSDDQFLRLCRSKSPHSYWWLVAIDNEEFQLPELWPVLWSLGCGFMLCACACCCCCWWYWCTRHCTPLLLQQPHQMHSPLAYPLQKLILKMEGVLGRNPTSYIPCTPLGQGGGGQNPTNSSNWGMKSELNLESMR
jgi:hypothetical protein